MTNALAPAALGVAELAAQFALLSDPLRLHIVTALVFEQLCTCHLIDITGAKQTTVSHHLRTLREAGVIEGRTQGRFTWYRLAPHAFGNAAELLAGLSAASEPQRLRVTCEP
jgi:ArsR family transcriptional regulator, arsenate/arsenite/antimonite-responsive transcriptional repressor